MKINHHRIIEGMWTPWYFSHGEVTSDNSISQAERDKESLSTILFFANKKELRPTRPSRVGTECMAQLLLQKFVKALRRKAPILFYY